MTYIYYIIGSIVTAAIAAATAFIVKSKNKTKPSVDQVDYKLLKWTCGGVAAPKASLSAVRISNLNVQTPNSLTLHWDIGMEVWGYDAKVANGLACLFCKVDGEWVGGKFEWISTSRASRSLGNCRGGYSGWKESYLKATEYAFVVLSSDAKNRSNVIYFKK